VVEQTGLGSQVLNVDVGAESYVVGEVPAVVVGIVVDDDVVAVPKPLVAEADVEVGDAEVETAEPKASRTAACQMPDVAAADAAGEASMLPGMIEVVVSVCAARVVADPFSIGMDVWGVGVTGVIVKVPVLRRGMWTAYWSWAMRGNMRRSATDAAVTLGKGCKRKQEA